MGTRSLSSVLAVVVLTVASGCASSTPQATTPDGTAATAGQSDAEQDENRLPVRLEELDLSAVQRAKILALKADLERSLEPMKDAADELALAVAKTAERCDGNVVALDDASSWAVTVGEQVRGAVLDSVDRLHAILTPEQRKALAERLLQPPDDEKGERNTEKGVRSVGGELDLSVGQIVQLLIRAQALRNVIKERLEPWRLKLRVALRAFPSADFSIRDHEIAQVPAASIATNFLRDAVRTLLPIFGPQQCKAVGEMIREAVEESEAE